MRVSVPQTYKKAETTGTLSVNSVTESKRCVTQNQPLKGPNLSFREEKDRESSSLKRPVPKIVIMRVPLPSKLDRGSSQKCLRLSSEQRQRNTLQSLDRKQESSVIETMERQKCSNQVEARAKINTIVEVSQNKVAISSCVGEEDITVTPDEEKIYGKRFMVGYDRVKLLGKGGQAVVWLAIRKSDSTSFAVKQIALGGYVSEKLGRKESEFNELLFGGPAPKDNLVTIGLRSIVRVKETQVTQKDIFMAIELCGVPLSKLIYTMKGEFLKSERIYGIITNSLFIEIRTNFHLFRKLLTQLLVGLHAMTSKGIVHCDLKPENILIRYNSWDCDTEEVKIIDFGAAFQFNGLPFLTVTTPEYLPPEFLLLFSHKKNLNNRQKHEWLQKTSHPWSIDIWSLGVILIELLIGVPVWMSFKCRLSVDGREQLLMGLFSSPSRDNDKIAEKMIKFVPGMKKKLADIIGNFPHLDQVMDLVEKMLCLDPLKRPSPIELLSHPLFEV